MTTTVTALASRVARVVAAKVFDSRTGRISGRGLDALLTVPTPEEWAQYFAQRAKVNMGRVWTGELKSALDTLDSGTVRDMLADFVDYANMRVDAENELGPNEQFGSNGEIIRKPNNTNDNGRRASTRDFGRPVTPESINDANSRFWAERLSKPTNDIRKVGTTPESINEANQKFWAQR